MNRKTIASLTTATLLGTACVLAANPFVDVQSDSWAYKSVVELANAGVIQGVDGSYFQGNRNITRYEAAEMVAKAMAHMDKASLEQRATINKLANEYADELNSLGVRISNLEKRVGNIRMSGDYYIRYINQKNAFIGDNGNKKDDQWIHRARLRANATISENTVAQVGFSTDDRAFDDATAASSQHGFYNDDAWVQHFFNNNFNVKVGRWDAYILGNAYGYQYGNALDGIQAQYNNGHIAVTAGYGKFKDVIGNVYQLTPSTSTATIDHELNNLKTGYGEIEGLFKNGAIGVYFNSFNGRSATGDGTFSTTTNFIAQPDHLWGAYGKVNFGKDWQFMVDYQKVTPSDESKQHNIDTANIWTAKLQYGQAMFDKKGSWDAWAEYINADANALYGKTWSWRNINILDNVRSFGIGIDYTWTKNAQIQLIQSFASQVKDDKWGNDPDEETRVQFMFVF